MTVGTRLANVEEALRLLRDADRLQGRRMSATAPNDNELVGWNATTKKWEPKAPTILIARATSDLTLTTSDQSIVGDGDSTKVRLLVPTVGDWLVLATVDFEETTGAAGDLRGSLYVDDSGSAETGKAVLNPPGGGADPTNARATVSHYWVVTVTTADTPVELKALKQNAGGVAKANLNNTVLVAIGIAGGTTSGGASAHGDLSGVTSDQHHNESHEHTGSGHIFPDAGELTIAAGEITVTGTWHTVDTQGDAGSDLLVTINGGSDGMVIFLAPDDDTHTIILDHDAGNISCMGGYDIYLDDVEDVVMLVYSGAESKWFAARFAVPNIEQVLLTTQGGTAGDANAARLRHLGLFNFKQGATLTIDGNGDINATHTYHRVQGAGGGADDLEKITVTGTELAGQLLIFHRAAGVGTITVKHNVDNIQCVGSADFDLDQDWSWFWALYDASVGKWMAMPGFGAGGGYTDADAIAAVEGEATLDLTGDVTIAGAKTLKVDVIDEKDADAGVTTENVTAKDGSIELHHGTDTISSDEITSPTGGYIIAAAEASTTDDLDGIGGGANGRIIVIRADAGDVITVRHDDAGGGSGRKIFLFNNLDIALTGGDDNSLILIYDEALDSGNGAWFEIARSDILSLALATVFVSDSGNAAPSTATNALAIVGGEGIDTSGAGATVTVTGEDATTSNKGIVELATTAEIDAATPSRAVTTDALGDSIYSERILGFLISDPGGDALTTGDTKALARIPSSMNGYELVEANACVTTVSSSGPVTIQVAKSSRTNATTRTASVNMLSTPITIDVSEFDSLDAAAEVIQTDGKEDVVTGDQIRIDIDAAGTGAKGLFVELIFRLK